MPKIIIEGGDIPTHLKAFETYQLYNVLDCCYTAQLADNMLELMNDNHKHTYSHEMRMLSLCLDMSLRGFPIDRWELAQLLHELDVKARKNKTRLDLFCKAIWVPPFNPNSFPKVEEFFYDVLDLPVIWKFDHKTGRRKRGTDRGSLEKLAQQYPVARPFVSAILGYREATKLKSVFTRGLETTTGRLRCQFNPTGTTTGRLSSQGNPYGRGTNAQNLNDRVRRVIAAPDGYVIAYVDLKSAESYAVGYISEDQAYIDACSNGDIHTNVARLVFPSLEWTGDLSRDKHLAEQPFYRHFSYRDMSKRGGHASNYFGKPRTVGMNLKVPTNVIEDFQESYFKAFPGIKNWQLETIARIQSTGVIINPLGRERRFWGRSSDEATWRAAIAHGPQSMVAEVMNEGLMQVQDWNIRNKIGIEILAQEHDAGVFLIPLDGLDEIMLELLQRIVYPVDFGRLGVLSIPADAKVGLNWSEKDTTKGLRKWTPGKELCFG